MVFYLFISVAFSVVPGAPVHSEGICFEVLYNPSEISLEIIFTSVLFVLYLHLHSLSLSLIAVHLQPPSSSSPLSSTHMFLITWMLGLSLNNVITHTFPAESNDHSITEAG